MSDTKREAQRWSANAWTNNQPNSGRFVLYKDYAALERENAELRAENERLKADGARLDWLDFIVPIGCLDGWRTTYAQVTVLFDGDTPVRETIDAAMKGEK